MADYRCTKYEKALVVDYSRKEQLRGLITSEHPNTKNHYSLIHNNDLKYKRLFARIYNDKCAYCGLPIDLVPLNLYEIDHYVPEKTNEGESLNDISNLVLSCKCCNIKKSGFSFNEKENQDICFPDNNSIVEVFSRTDNYSITINKPYKSNPDIVSFYRKMNFGSHIKRLDYLVMSMIGFRNSLLNYGKKEVVSVLELTIGILIHKRNTITGDALIID